MRLFQTIENKQTFGNTLLDNYFNVRNAQFSQLQLMNTPITFK